MFIADEVQTGIGRCGRKLATEYDNVKPDIVTIGKSLCGAFHCMAAVLARSDLVLGIGLGQHSTTFMANPLVKKNNNIITGTKKKNYKQTFATLIGPLS